MSNTISNANEDLRKNPEQYLSKIDFDIFDTSPDLSIMEDNQIIDLVIDKAMKDIQQICDIENSKTSIIKDLKVPSEDLVKEYDRIFKPEYIDEGMEKPDFDELLYKA